jgi:tetratricopeptide (TPR) repeat protein
MKMNKTLVTLVVTFAMAGFALGGPLGGGGQSAQKAIKDPSEYAAYMAARNNADPAEKAVALEAFSKRYPKSVVYVDAMEQAMEAYQQTGNLAKVEEMAGQILAANPDNVRALAIVCVIDRGRAALKAAGEDCAKGLQALPNWQKPDGMTDEQFKVLHDQMSRVFNGGSGFVALNRKDFVAAREFYLKALQVDSYDIENNYQLSIADFSMEPMDPNGLWYAVRAANQLTGQGSPGADKVLAFAKARYVKYHGGEDGWFQFLAAVATQSAPPSPLGVKPAPAP